MDEAPPELRRSGRDELSALDGLVELSRLVRASTSTHEMLGGLARIVGWSLHYEAVVVNMHRPVTDDFVVEAIVGDAALVEALEGTSSTQEMWTSILTPEIERHGSFFVPTGTYDWSSSGFVSHAPAPVDGATDGVWLPEDALFAPLLAQSGALLGVISVDLPRDGRRPDEVQLRALGAVASHAALAIEQRQAEDRVGEQSRALGELLDVAARLNDSLDVEHTLNVVRDGVRDALGFASVSVAVREGDTLRFRVGTGAAPVGFVLGLRRLRDVWDATDGDSVIRLLSADEVRDLWPGPTPARVGGGGPRAWAGHLLLVALPDGDGEPAGLMVVEGPADGLLPAPDRMHALRLFAAQAAATLDSAAQRAWRLERRRARHLAHHDGLTGLPNRAALTAAVDAQLQHEGPLSVLSIDLDGFRVVNDALGHRAGDAVLRSISGRLVNAAGDHLVGRLGGDEFGILVPGSGDDVAAVVHRVHAALRTPFCLDSGEHRLTASVGVATNDGATVADDLLQRAGVATRQAKTVLGPSTAQYDASTDEAAARLETTNALARAAARDELELHYQPIVSADGGTLVALEALLRWRRDGRLVPPLEFIGLAEQTGLIGAIGAWVIGRAASQSAAWTELGFDPPPIAVNVSPQQLRDGRFTDVVRCALADHRLGPGALTIEVTESALVPGGRVVSELAALRDMGVRCALDDFGADYSSLSRLRDLPVDVLKIDRAFLADVPGSARATKLLRATIAVGEALGLDVVVEGIETPAQGREVRAASDLVHCQGFYFGRPVDAAGAQSWLERAAGR